MTAYADSHYIAGTRLQCETPYGCKPAIGAGTFAPVLHS